MTVDSNLTNYSYQPPALILNIPTEFGLVTALWLIHTEEWPKCETDFEPFCCVQCSTRDPVNLQRQTVQNELTSHTISLLLYGLVQKCTELQSCCMSCSSVHLLLNQTRQRGEGSVCTSPAAEIENNQHTRGASPRAALVCLFCFFIQSWS